MEDSSMKCILGLTLAILMLLTLPLAAQQTGTLKVKADPGRTGLFLDGKYLGPAANFRMARTYTVPAGEHELKLEEPRYEEVVKKITIESGKKIVIAEKMKALPIPKGPFGRLRTENTDKFAAVYVNNKFYGHVDEFSNSSQGLLLPPGEYEVRVEPTAGGAPVTQKVKLEADRTVVVK
jgi:hypothetical protein